MKKIIKYLQGGEYHEATVADVGDLDLLKTESKTDLVSAINEIFATGGSGSKIPDGYGELVEKVEVINNESHENTQAISDAVKEIEEAKRKLAETAIEIENTRQQGLLDAQKAAQKAVDDYDNARKKLDEELAKAQQQLSKDIADKQTSIEELNNKASTLNNQLSKVKESSELTAKNLAEATLDLGKTKKQITNLENEVSQKLSNTDLDPLKEKVASVDTEVKQTREELSAKANKKDLDLLTGTVNDVNSRLTVATDKIESKVSRDTLEKNISDFQVKKANLLSGTRDWLDSSVNDNALARVSSETYSHARIAILDNGGSITLVGRNLTVGESYTLSVNASVSEYHEGTFPVINVSSIGTMKTVDTKDEKVTTNWQRYFINFVASGTEVELILQGVNIDNGESLRLNKPKLEKGIVPYPWEQNENDDYERIEHTEAKLSIYDDRITGVTKKQSEYWDKQIELQTAVAQVAEGVSANMSLLESTKDGLVKEFDGKLSATAKNLTTEYSERTNEAIGQLTDSGVNLVLNSSFANTENHFSKWQEVSSKANIITDTNGLNWLSLKQSGMTYRNPIAAKSNYFPVKKGKLTAAVDIKVNIPPDDKIFAIDFYDSNNQRVDYKDFTLADMGVESSGGTKGRGLVRVGIDRSDVVKATVKGQLLKNGDIEFTNFLAKNSSIDDGAYIPNPEDTSEQFIKQNTKIEQNARAIEAKASSTEVANKLNDLDGKLRQEITTQKDAVIKVSSDGIEQVTRKVETAQSIANNAQTTANRAQSTADSVNASFGAYQRVTESTIKNMGDRIESSVSSTKKMVDDMQIGGTNILRGTEDYKNWTVVHGGFKDDDEGVLKTKMVHYWMDQGQTFCKESGFSAKYPIHLVKGQQYTISCKAKYYSPNPKGREVGGQNLRMFSDYTDQHGGAGFLLTETLTDQWQKYSCTFTSDTNGDFGGWRIMNWRNSGFDGGSNFIGEIKIEEGNKATPWSPAPEDIQSQINGNKQAIESANSKIAQVENGFNATAERVRNDLDGKITKNSNDIKAFDDKYSRELSYVKADLNTKATQSWAQNKIEETANSVTRTIETVKNTIDSIGAPNLILNGCDPKNLDYWTDWTRTTRHSYYFNSNKRLFEVEAKTDKEVTPRSNRFKLKHNTDYGISFIGFASANVKDIDVYILGRKNGESQDYTKVIQPIANKKLSALRAEYITATFNSGDVDEAYIRFDNNGSSNGQIASLFIAEVMVNEGAPSRYRPNPDEAVDKLSVGGRNYLQGSLDFTWIGGVQGNAAAKWSIEPSDDGVGKMVHVTGNRDNGGIYTKWAEAFPNGTIKTGEIYTFSFDAKGSGTFASAGNESDWGQLKGVNLSNNWKRYTVTGTVRQDAKAYIIYFHQNFDAYIRRVKIEKGNKATDYTQAPEDIQSQINGNKQAIEINKHKLEETDRKLESQFQTINDYGNRISASESKLKQTAENIGFTVSKIVNDNTKKSGELQNLIYNSEFSNNAEGWSNVGINPAGLIGYSNNEWDNWYGSAGLRFRNENKQDYLVSESKRFKVNGSEKLSASIQLHVTDNITKGNCRAGMEIKFYANETDPEIATSNQSTQFIYDIWNGQQKLLYCNNVSIPSDAHYVAMRIYTFGVGNIVFNQPMLVSDENVIPYKQDAKMLDNLSDKYAKLQVKADSIEGIVANKADISIVNQKADQWNVRVANLQNDMQGQINNRVEKNRVVTEINADASGVRINANKLEINGDTKINGVLNTNNVVMRSQGGAVSFTPEHLEISGRDSAVILGNSDMRLGSTTADPRYRWGIGLSRFGMEFGVPVKKNGHIGDEPSDYSYEIQGFINGSGWDYSTMHNPIGNGGSGIEIGLMTNQRWGTPYGGDYIGIGEYIKGKSDSPLTKRFDPAISYSTTGAGIIPRDIHLFKPTTFHSEVHMNVPSTGYGIRTAWVSWSDWNNEKYPCFVNDNGNWGGIAFPQNGNVVLFNPAGMRYNIYETKYDKLYNNHGGY